ncbi:DNA-binding response regulator [Nocardioides sp. MAH-18]|uniref:DNA-binding response regulator n=2 Tax=Nocardioidaceae TaxID=85015 RepID=A0A6L6XNF2_9ACTN|nr:response regulator transcription factor [Nocardioides sp. CGMCC 1.13656]MVQ48116.1 DNA-binding response regulator [Nocardioides sp. MAH-18]
MIRVALSNDYEIALLGLAAMLAQHPDRVQIVDLTTETDMSHDPDLVLFDTFGRLPEEDAKLRQVIESNDAKVVVYSWDDYPEEAARRQGAAGYLSKSLSSADLVAGIVAIHEGRQPTAPTDDGDAELTWPGQVHGLSAREAEMLTFIVRGLRNEEIARRAYLSINTVKTYIRTAYRKIGVTNRAQAVAWGFRNGFGSTDETGV